MRTIKFRAWYEQSQKFVYIHIGEVMTDVANAIYSNICLNGGKWYQFTGLLDKNGVEIYEGDVVEQKYVDSFGVVYYNEDGACYFVRPLKINNGIELFLNSDLMKIIGNIHENPDLLLSK